MSFFRRHLTEIMKTDTLPAPWTRMILCGLATCAPLLVGLVRGQLIISIFGALTGYLLALNDHLGALKHRLWVTTLTFIVLLGGFAAGYYLKSKGIEYVIALGSVTYWLGVLAGEGAELERAVLFATFSLIVAHSANGVIPESFPLLFVYVLIAYVCLMIGIPLLLRITKSKPDPFIGLKESLRKSLTARRDKHTYAFSYVCTVLLSLWATDYFQFERGYWITGTALLVMKPDRIQSFYKPLQRLIGTVLGVLIVDVIIQIVQDPRPLVVLIVGSAFAIPWAMKRNYWIMTFFATIMVVLLLELSAVHHGDVHTSFVRLQATLWGCVLALFGTMLSKLADTQTQRAKDAFSRLA